jgi:hypothetical protein
MFGIATVAAAAAPVAAAALKNLRLEGVLTPFIFLSFDIRPPFYLRKYLSINLLQSLYFI